MNASRHHRHLRGHSGVSLIEAVLAVAIVAIMMVAALDVVGSSARTRAIQTEQSRATALAKQLLSEIVQCRYADAGSSPVFGPESGEVRANFDDVDDFHNWTESPPQTGSGTALAGFTGWKRSVKVEYADPTNPSSNASSDQGLKRITVTVTTPTGKTTTLVGLRSRNGGYEKSVQTTTTYTSWASLSVQAGTNSNTGTVSSTNLVNQAP